MRDRRSTKALTALVLGLGLATVPAGSANAAFTFTVNAAQDGGDTNLTDNLCDSSPTAGLQCTFRASLQQANATAGVDTINFDIPVANGVATISPRSALPPITDAVVINGYSQAGATPNTKATGNNAVLKIELSGARAGTGVDGLVVEADGCTIKGLVINRFGGDGIAVSGSGNTLEGNLVGTRASGKAAAANGENGVFITGPSNAVGAPAPEARNVISGNGGYGVLVASTGTHIENSYIGTNKAGNAALGNQDGGVAAAANTVIGGARNVISGNGGDGIGVSFSSQAVIAGNFIGTNATGTAAIANADDGIDSFQGIGLLIGGTAVAARNVISGNVSDGIEVAGSGVTIQNNIVGLNATGSAALGNGGSGVSLGNGPVVVGGTQPGARNVISGNATHGVHAVGSGNTIAGNFIGTDLTGEVDLGNAAGIFVFGDDNTIGGTDPAAKNVISGNVDGIHLSGTTGNVVQGNAIGVSASGAPLPNSTGIALLAADGNTIGGAGAAGNVVSRNGVGLDLVIGGDNEVIGNAITGNTSDGVRIHGSDNTISGNLIIANGRHGVSVSSGAGNRITSNQIIANTLLGIDLVGGTQDGFSVTANDPDDPDTGPNNLQNYPVITSAIRSNTTTITTIVGTLDSTASTDFTIQCFLAEGDPSGHGEAQVFLNSKAITTNASGDAGFSCVTGVLSPGMKVSALAINEDTNDTSEFSLNGTVVPGP